MTIFHPRRRALLGALGISLLGRPLAAKAQTGKPVRVILPVSAGSGIDTIVRTASAALGKAFDAPIVVENQPGAGGITGAASVKKAAPDGLTLGFVSNNHVINPAIYRKMPYDAVNDFTPLSVVGASHLALLAHPKLAAHNVQELVALLKARPEAYNYASSGNGTVIHLAAEMFLDEAGVRAKHIPYRGVGPMVNDLLSGQVDFGVVGMSAAGPHIRSGALRAIGVCGPRRSPAEPGLPTIAEQGLPNYAIEGWFAFIGPAGMARADVERVHAALVVAFRDQAVLDAMEKAGTSIRPSSPQQALSFFKAETARYAQLAQKAGLTLD